MFTKPYRTILLLSLLLLISSCSTKKSLGLIGNITIQQQNIMGTLMETKV